MLVVFFGFVNLSKYSLWHWGGFLYCPQSLSSEQGGNFETKYKDALFTTNFFKGFYYWHFFKEKLWVIIGRYIMKIKLPSLMCIYWFSACKNWPPLAPLIHTYPHPDRWRCSLPTCHATQNLLNETYIPEPCHSSNSQFVLAPSISRLKGDLRT